MPKGRTGLIALFTRFVFLLVGLLAAGRAAAQSAPVPAQITSAEKVFLADTVGMFDESIWNGHQDRLYNEFYAAMKAWGRFQLVDTPAGADLVLRPSISNPHCIGIAQCRADPVMRLEALDPKTGIVLWDRMTFIGYRGRTKTDESYFEAAVNALMSDLKAAAVQATPAK